MRTLAGEPPKMTMRVLVLQTSILRQPDPTSKFTIIHHLQRPLHLGYCGSGTAQRSDGQGPTVRGGSDLAVRRGTTSGALTQGEKPGEEWRCRGC